MTKSYKEITRLAWQNFWVCQSQFPRRAFFFINVFILRSKKKLSRFIISTRGKESAYILAKNALTESPSRINCFDLFCFCKSPQNLKILSLLRSGTFPKLTLNLKLFCPNQLSWNLNCEWNLLSQNYASILAVLRLVDKLPRSTLVGWHRKRPVHFG